MCPTPIVEAQEFILLHQPTFIPFACRFFPPVIVSPHHSASSPVRLRILPCRWQVGSFYREVVILSKPKLVPAIMLTALREHEGTVTNQELPRHKQRFPISHEWPSTGSRMICRD